MGNSVLCGSEVQTSCPEIPQKDTSKTVGFKDVNQVFTSSPCYSESTDTESEIENDENEEKHDEADENIPQRIVIVSIHLPLVISLNSQKSEEKQKKMGYCLG